MTQVPLASLVVAARCGRQLISFPTDTVPALASQPDIAEQLFQAKQRQPDKPLILMAATASSLWPYVQGSDRERHMWRDMAQRYWPGALTLVLPASDCVPAAVNPLDPTTIGLRVPAWPLAQTILQQTGPLATTSVNRSGQPPLAALAEIEAQFPQVLTPLADQWLLPYSQPQANLTQLPSTVIQWTGQDWQVLRQGQVNPRSN